MAEGDLSSLPFNSQTRPRQARIWGSEARLWLRAASYYGGVSRNESRG